MRNSAVHITGCVLLLASSCLSAADTAEQQESLDDIYRRVFGAKEALPGELESDMKVAGQGSGQIRVLTDTTKITHVQRDTLLTAVEAFLKPDIYQGLATASAGNEWITDQQLGAAGLTASYNSMDLTIDIAIKRESMNRRMRSILSTLSGHKGMMIPEKLVEPAKASAYVNVYSGLSYDHQALQNPAHFNVRSEGAVNINGFVLEGQYSYQSGNTQTPLTRDYTRLVIDDPENEYRYQIGDINTQGRNFQNRMDLGGVQLIQNLIWTDPQEYRPQGDYPFKLDGSAEVEVYQDGNLTQTTRLNAGDHKLSELHADQGNEVELKIKDDFGTTKSLHFSRFTDNNLLSPEFSRYAISAGFPAQRMNGKIQYDTRHPVASAYYQTGITDSLTAGVDAQTDGKAYQVGTDAIWATPLGNVNAGISHSRTATGKTGEVARLQMNSLEEHPTDVRSKKPKYQWPGWNVAVQHMSRDFQSFSVTPQTTTATTANVTEQAQHVEWQLSGGLSQRLGHSAGININTSQTRYFNATPNRSVGAGLSASLGKHLNLSINGTKRHDSQGKTDKSWYLSMNLNMDPTPSKRSQNLSESYNNYNGLNSSSRLTYSLGDKGRYGLDSLAGSVQLQSQKSKSALGADMRMRGEKFDLNASNQPSISDQTVGYYSYASLNTALVFADGEAAVSAPVQDSFAILDAPEGLEYPMAAKSGKTLFSHTSDDLHELPEYYDGVMQPGGSTVLPNFGAYQVQHISTDGAVLPEIYDLNATEFDLMPDYKSGYRLKVGGEPGLILQLTLLDSHGVALPLQGGQLTQPEKMAAAPPPIQFFTDEQGIASIMPLRPGRYHVELFSRPEANNLSIEVQGNPGETQTLELTVP